MKKIIAAILVIALCIPLAIPALAYEDATNNSIGYTSTRKGDDTLVIQSGDDTIEIRTYKSNSGSEMMDYYYNGELFRTYDLNGSPEGVIGYDEMGNAYLVKNYISTSATLIDTDIPAEFALNEHNLGVHYYRDTEDYRGNILRNPSVTISIGTVDSFMFRLQINTQVGDLVSDVVADISAILLATGAAIIVPVDPATRAGLAYAILTGLAANAGGSIIGNELRVALSVNQDLAILKQRIQAYGGGRTFGYICYAAFSAWNGMMYQYGDYCAEEGITPDNWDSSRNAAVEFVDTYGVYGYVTPPVMKTIRFDD